MTMRKGNAIERTADLIALLVKAPRTVPELARVAQTTTATAERWIKALAAEGLLEAVGQRKGLRGPPARVWQWVYGPKEGQP